MASTNPKANLESLKEPNAFNITSEDLASVNQATPNPRPWEDVPMFNRFSTEDANNYGGIWSIPIQDENASPAGIPGTVSPLAMLTTEFGINALNSVQNIYQLVEANNYDLLHFSDGLFNEGVQVDAPLTAEQKGVVLKAYPGLEIGKEASVQQTEAAMDRYERERALEYLDTHASPGIATQAASFVGSTAGDLLNYPALKGAHWASKGVQAGSELLAKNFAESAVTRLGGTASIRAEQMIADNAGKIAALQGAAGFGAFTAIEEGIHIAGAKQSGVLTPNEADYQLMDGVFNVASSGLVGGLLGLGAEKLTGKLVDKAFMSKAAQAKSRATEEEIETQEERQARREERRQRTREEREEMLNNIHKMSFEPGSMGELYKKASQVVKAFFQSHKESSERETLDNVSQALEAGKNPDSSYLHEINRQQAWQRLHGFIEQAGLTPEQFADALKTMREDLMQDFDAEKADIEQLQEIAMNEALINLAEAQGTEVMPMDSTKAKFLDSMRRNVPNMDNEELPKLDFDEKFKKPDDLLTEQIESISREELEDLASNKGNKYARYALNRRSFLELEKPFRDFANRFVHRIAEDFESGANFDSNYVAQLLEGLDPADIEGFQSILDAKPKEYEFMLDSLRNIIDDIEERVRLNDAAFTVSEIEEMVNRELTYIKAQVIRAQKDAYAYRNKLEVLQNAIDALDTKDGQALKQGINAILDRSMFQFKGANSGTYRKMKTAESNFLQKLNLALDDDAAMEFWNDPNSSLEITQALEAEQLGLSTDGFSKPARKVARTINRFYEKALDDYAKEGIIIPRLRGRIHNQWHNAYKINKQPLFSIKKSRVEVTNENFEKWYDFIKDKVDLEATFLKQRGEIDEGAIDINDPKQVKEAMRKTFDKIIQRDFRREKSNIGRRRAKERIYHFKSAEDFHAYNQRYGSGTAQHAIIRELSNMFREIELVKDWGAEPESMLDDVMEHVKDLPGWKDWEISKGADTPQRLMRLMRFGAAHSGTAFTELIYNLKAYESVTKLGNLLFLNFTDSLTAANALNRFSIPMQESIVNGIKETFARYTPEQKQDYLKMFGIAKEQYFGAFYRHFEDGTLSAHLNNMLRTTMKLTGTENSEYSNRSMVGQSLSNWFATNLKRMGFNQLDEQTRFQLGRYNINKAEWDLMKDAVQNYKGNDYLGWDNILELSDERIASYLKEQGVKKPNRARIDRTRDDLAQRYRLLMQDQLDDAVNRKSLVETDLLRFRQAADRPHVMNDVINGMMLFKTYGFMWIRRHIGDRIYGRGAQGYRTSQIQGTADWHGVMKLMAYSFAMEFAIAQIKEISNTGKPLPLDGNTAMDALTGSLGPIAFLSRVDGSNFTSSVARMLAGPIGGDIDRIARIVSQFEKGYWKGDYSTAEVNSIKFLASQFGGVPMLKPALNTLLFDNIIQNIKGKRTGHVIDTVAANQKQEQTQ